MEDDKITLDSFFPSDAVTPIQDISDIDMDEDFVVYAGSNWCGHSQLGTAHYAEACRATNLDGKKTTCLGLDLAKEGGRELAEEMGLPDIRGVPALLKWKAKEREFETVATGRRNVPQYLEILKGGL